jgi:iron complex transport system permease protein
MHLYWEQDVKSAAIRQEQRRWLFLASGILVLPLCLILSLRLGAIPIPLSTIIGSFSSFDGSYNQLVIRLMRLPRALLALTVGGSLSVAGSLMQGLTRNPMGSPDILGINAGASLGVITASVLIAHASRIEYAAASLAGAAVAVFIIYVIAALSGEGPSSVSLVVGGTAVGAALGSITSAILLYHVRFQEQSKWLLGSLAGGDWRLLAAAGPFIVSGMLLAVALSPHLNAMALGEQTAQGLGMNTRLVSAGVTIATLLLAGGSVAAAGPVGFVGLMLPHLVRGIVGQDYRWVVPCSAIFGGLFLLLSDIVARALFAPVELPVGMVTALLGGPFFLVLARQRIKSQ